MSTKNKKIILLVEDEAIIALAESQAIKSFGYEVISAITGEKAIEAVTREENIHLILMDINLGKGITGPEAASKILSIKTIPIVFLTSHSEQEMVEKVRGITRYGYVIKNSGDFVLRSSIEMAFELFDAQKRITEREDRLLRAEIISGSGSWEFDLTNKTVIASDGTKKIYGLNEDNLSISDVQQIPLPQYRKMLDTALKDLIELDSPYDVEFEIKRKTDGKNIRIHSVAEFRKENNIVTGFIQDITSKRQMEEMFRIQHELILSLNSCNDLHQGLNKVLQTVLQLEFLDSGGIYIVNSADGSLDLAVFHGLSNNFISHSSHYTSDSRQAQVASSLNAYYGSYTDILPQDDEVRKNEGLKAFALIPIKSQDKLIALLNLSSHKYDDIPKNTRTMLETISFQIGGILLRLRTNTALQQSENKYRTFIDLAIDGMLIGTDEGIITDANRQLCEITGIEYNNILGKHFDDLSFIERSTKQNQFRFTQLKKEEIIKNERTIRRPDGSLIDVEIRTKMMPDGSYQSIFHDITENKKKQTALRESEKRYSLALEVGNAGVWIWNLSNNEVSFDERFHSMLGYTQGDLPKTIEAWIEYYHQDDITGMLSRAKEYQNGSSPIFESEHRLRAKDGRWNWIFTRGRLTENFETMTDKIFIGIAINITERKHAEDELHKSETKYRHLVDLAVDGIILGSHDGVIIEANKRTSEITGIEYKNLIGKHISSLPFTKDSIDKNPIRFDLVQKSELVTRERTIIRPDGSMIDIEMRTKIMPDGTYQSIYRDITERKILEKKLLNSEQKFVSAFKNNPYLLSITEIDSGVILEVNESFVRESGFSRDELIGKSLIELGMISEENRELLKQKLQKTGKVTDYEVLIHTKNGKDSLVRSNGEIIFVEGRDVLLSIAQDITEQKSAEEKIKSLLKEKELVLQEVHHRIKNNMNTINSLLSLQAHNSKNPSISDALNDARSRIQSMMVLYTKLYQSENINELSAKKYIPPLVDQIISNFNNGISVTAIKEIDDFILDTKRLSTLGIIINELITNCMKYAFADTNNAQITVSAFKNEKFISLYVQDNGVGLPKSEDFEHSTGFGLKLAGLLTKQLNGSIRIEREIGTKIILEFEI